MRWGKPRLGLNPASVSALALTGLVGCFSTDRVLGEFAGEAASLGGEATGGSAGATAAPDAGAAGNAGDASGTQRAVNGAVWVNELGEVRVAGYLTPRGGTLGRGYVARVTATGKQVELWTEQELWGLEGCGFGGLVAFGREAALHREGWTSLTLPPWLAESPPLGLLARSCSELLVVGQDGLTARHDGREWTALGSGGTATLRDLAPFGADASLAVGDAGAILRRVASDWLLEPSPTARDLHSVWTDGAELAYAAGGDAEGGWVILARGVEGWTVEAQGSRGRLRAIHGDGLERLIAVGEDTTDQEGRGFALARLGGTWVELPLETPRALYDLKVPAYAFAVAVGPADEYVRFSPRSDGSVAQLPVGAPRCADGELALLASPLLPDEACVDTTAAVPVACVGQEQASLVGAARCLRHLASGLAFFTRAPAAALVTAADWGPCDEPLPEPCPSRRCPSPPPPHLCSPSALCAAVGCGQGAFDGSGCLRPPCSVDEDCAPGERCAAVSVPVAGDCFEDHEGVCACSAEGATTEWRCTSDD